MSRSDQTRSKKAVALQYGPGDNAPVIVASGMGYLAEKIVETAADAGVPIYEDNSLSTILTQLQLYQAIVEIYVYFLRFDPTGNLQQAKEAHSQPPQSETQGQGEVTT